ncbi:MAG: hydrogenase maturation protease [Alphaproteobacteria bacterium]|nr:hydrogenase maturation protease [Alphaproteobacteria bacterium]MBV8407645.1 hydrogenase maturation protease [Alphaproteobacteria bacterium]
MTAADRVLVLGYGNPGRQDDGLGPAAAEEMARLGWPRVSVQDNYQLVIEDAADIAEHDVVWFVDAARSGAEPYEIRRLRAGPDLAFTSHLLKPETLLAIVEQYYGRSPDAYLLAIRGYEFEFLEGLSERASGNLAAAVTAMRRRIGTSVEQKP